MAEEADSEREILAMEEEQLEFVLNTAGIVEDCELSMPYRTQLTSDKWNLFLLRVEEFEDKILSEFLKEGEEKDVKEGMEVNVYDTGGHEFEAILKKWERVYYLSRGWLSFLDDKLLAQNDFVSLRAFRHAFNKKLSFLVTYTKINNN